MMASLLPNGKQQYDGSGGLPLVGGRIWTYAAGTSTPQATYADAAGTVPNTNPVILDARGEAVIFWSGSYKVRLEDALGLEIWTVDGLISTDGITTGKTPWVLPDEANGDTIPAAGSRLPYLSGGVLKIA